MKIKNRKGMVQSQLKNFGDRCKEAGLRMTRQRQEIFRAVASSSEHPCAEQVFARVRSKLPNLSLDTVYRTLSSLEEMGLLQRVGLSSKARFDGDARPHCHFVCTQCEEVYDVFLLPGEQLSIPSSVRTMGQIRQATVQFKGICKSCQSR